jgi:EmrB/QacA subfamily drug resistance transporter
MLAVGSSIFMGTLDVNIVSVSLPTLVQDLGARFSTIQWVILAYILALASLTLNFGRLGDMWGRKKLFMLGLGVFILGSLCCGLAPGIGWLIAARALQGTGAAMTQALGVAIITEAFPATERGKALGIMGSVVSVGLALGPALGGVLIAAFGWRSVFLVNLPVGVFGIWAALRFVPVSAPRTGQTFDLWGAGVLLGTLGLYAMGMTLGQTQGFSQGPLLLIAGAGLGLGLLILVERNVAQPTVDLGLFKNPLFSMNLFMGWLVFVVIGGSYIIPFFLQLVQGRPPRTVGFLMMVMPLTMGMVAPLAGFLADRYGSREVSVMGLFAALAGCLAVSGLKADMTIWGVALRLAPFGLGMGLFQSPNNSAIMGAAPKERLGLASSLLALSRTMGNTTGIPMAGAIFAALALNLAPRPDLGVTHAPPEALVAGLQGTYRLAGLVIGIAAVVALGAWWLDRRKNRAEEGT